MITAPMNEEFSSLCSLLCDPSFDGILVLSHAKPDGDALGSAYALCLALRKMGKQAGVFCEKRDDDTFDFITCLADRGDFPIRRVICVDVASPELLYGLDPDAQVDVAIDHHRNNRVEAPAKLCLCDRAACGEIVFELLQQLSVPMDEAIARCLYTAIATDTGRFCYANTTRRTFAIAAELCSYSAVGNFADINKRVFETVSQKTMLLEAYAAKHCRLFFEGAFAALVVDEEEKKRLNAKESDYDGLINVLRRIKGVRVAAFLRWRDGAYKVSLRGEPGFDCAALCERFGGGGHKGAAGCTLKGDASFVLEQMVNAVGEEL